MPSEGYEGGYPMTQPSDEILISADAHVGETDDLWKRIPEPLRRYAATYEMHKDGSFYLEIEGIPVDFQVIDGEPNFDKEFRKDPSYGTDVDVRRRHMAREGVDAQVMFPNAGLGMGVGNVPAEFRIAWARAHNDYVHDLFGIDPERFKPAAMIPVDDIDAAVDEARRCVERGFASLFLPCAVPWRPYGMPFYEPLWCFAEEARVPLNFHVFSGNLALGGDFAAVGLVPQDKVEVSRRSLASRTEEQLETVAGMAAGMSPIIELTGSHVLERHPELRFIVTEGECGWLAWTLQAMDQMQERRNLGMRRLPMRASDYFRRQGAVSITDDRVALNNVEFTGSDCLVWGNDYPHDEGTFPDSRRQIDEIYKRLGDRDARKVLCENAARIFGFDLEKLAARKHEIAAAAH
jgi:predicted TIM-barrel fold metal-dependent hydrolase